MPEGPSIVILKEAVSQFKGKKVLAAAGSSAIDMDRILHQPVKDFKSWGKHFLICFPTFSIRIHFLLFGSYSINEASNKKPRLHLHFTNGDLYFYACAIRIIEEDLNDVYDWSADVMNKNWDAKQARKKLKEQPDTLVCDALLDQTIFSGVGNIIKNEVLFRIKVHPKSTVGLLPPAKLNKLIQQAQQYSFDFLEWKKENVLKKHWIIHTKKTCPRCELPVIKEYAGKTKRRTFFCDNCQLLYGERGTRNAKGKTRNAEGKARKAKRLTQNAKPAAPKTRRITQKAKQQT